MQEAGQVEDKIEAMEEIVTPANCNLGSFAKHKWYVVACGQNCGVYDILDDANDEVLGYSGYKCRGFKARYEVERWLLSEIGTSFGSASFPTLHNVVPKIHQ